MTEKNQIREWVKTEVGEATRHSTGETGNREITSGFECMIKKKKNEKGGREAGDLVCEVNDSLCNQ